ncbi:MAG: RQC domain-containing protein, partial [Planctomycetia bacterium]
EEWPDDGCGNCDNCLEARESWDATIDAQKLLSCIYRIGVKNGFTVGWRHLADVLAGADTEKIRRWGHDALSTYGIGKDKSRDEWVALGRRLTQLGLTAVGADERPTVSLTDKGLATLKERTAVVIDRPVTRSASAVKGRTGGVAAKAGDLPCDEGLFQRLRVLRKTLADERDVPAYVVFSDVTLRHVARAYPTSASEFLTIPGVGERKRAEFGETFVAAVEEWLVGNPRQEFADLKPTERLVPKSAAVAGAMSTSTLDTLRRFRAGDDVLEIAQARGFAVSTIESHLAQAVEQGEALDPGRFYTSEEAERMRAAFIGNEYAGLTILFEKLGGEISYGKLKIFRALASRRPSES